MKTLRDRSYWGGKETLRVRTCGWRSNYMEEDHVGKRGNVVGLEGCRPGQDGSREDWEFDSGRSVEMVEAKVYFKSKPLYNSGLWNPWTPTYNRNLSEGNQLHNVNSISLKLTLWILASFSSSTQPSVACSMPRHWKWWKASSFTISMCSAWGTW